MQNFSKTRHFGYFLNKFWLLFRHLRQKSSDFHIQIGHIYIFMGSYYLIQSFCPKTGLLRGIF